MIDNNLVNDFYDFYIDMDYMDYTETMEYDIKAAENALMTAYNFHSKYYHSENPATLSRRDNEYNSFPELVKNALSFLCDCGLIQ